MSTGNQRRGNNIVQSDGYDPKSAAAQKILAERATQEWLDSEGFASKAARGADWRESTFPSDDNGAKELQR